jgi:hypothetical protein
MNRLIVAAVLFLGCETVSAGNEIRVQAEILEDSSAARIQDLLPTNFDFAVEALYPRRNNQSRAKIEIRYSCVDAESGGLIAPCFIQIDPPIARPNSGGHIDSLHQAERPTGRNVPSEGYVDEQTGYLNATYYAPEIGGIVDSAIHCATSWVNCRDGTVSFGVGLQSLQDIGVGPGYTLTGDKSQHPSNHWGEPSFLAAVKNVARLFVEQFPGSPLLYNDISLQYGGVFDVQAYTQTGYDWTPPHSTHRLGTNMDIGIPRENGKRAALLRLYQVSGVQVYQEDAHHWHLIY